MSTQTLRFPLSSPRPTPATPVSPGPRREYRERDFGVGYGRSSGYASVRSYAAPWNGQPRFRCG